MPNTQPDTAILIVGAGPIGLFLANECARRGLRYQLVETHASQSEHSKALAIFPRTLEIFDMAGIVTPFLQAANRVSNVDIISQQRQLAHMRFAPENSPYPFVAMVPQDVTEKLLLEALRRQGGHPEYETTFVSADQQTDSVRVTLERQGRPVTLEASFVVGCDGAHSAVRHTLNIPFVGVAYEGTFLVADVQTNETLPADAMQLCPSEHGPVAIFPMSSSSRRIVSTIGDAQGDAPSLELVQKILAERGPAGIEAVSLHWSSYFHIQYRRVAHLRVGRIFVAGDAAHVHSPFGGQGMNTGLQDVWNLVWKLDFFLRGLAHEELLDTYNAERLPVIENVIETTDRLTRTMSTPSKSAQALRDAVIPIIYSLAPFRRAFVQRLAELGVAYSDSPIVEGSGNRYFDESIRGGQGIGPRFLLMIDDAASSLALDGAERLCDSFSSVVELRPVRHPGVTLVRPDGYAAYSSDNADAAAFDSVRSLLHRQTIPDQASAAHAT